MRRFSLGLALVGGLSLAACRTPPTSVPFATGEIDAEIARLTERVQKRPQDLEAWRDLAHLHWLYKADATTARPMLDRIASEGDLAGHLSLVIMASARMDETAVFEHAAYILRAAAEPAADGEGKPDAARRATADAIAEPALRRVLSIYGERDGDEARYVELFDSLDLSELPVESQHGIQAFRGRVERRHHRPFRDHFARQGCVWNWTLGTVQGHLGALELARDVATPFEVDARAASHPMSCAVRLWNPNAGPGVRRALTEFEVPEGEDAVVLYTDASWPHRVYVDGKLVFAGDDVDAFPVDEPSFNLLLPPGKHTLEMALTIPDESAWGTVRLSTRDGRALVTRKADPAAAKRPQAQWADFARARVVPWDDPERAGALLPGRALAPLRAYLALEDALGDGAPDRAETTARALLDSAHFAEAHLMLADFEREDPTRGPTASAAREQAALERALELDPSIDGAHLRLMTMRLGRGEIADVATELAELNPDRFRGLSMALFRFRVWRQRGNELLADGALARAAEINPESCRVRSTQLSLASERERVAEVDRLIDSITDCQGGHDERAQHAARRGRIADARAIWEERLAIQPDDLEALGALAQLAAIEKRWDDAVAAHRAILEFAPFRGSSRIALADLLIQAGRAEEGRKEVELALRLAPTSTRLREVAARLGITDDLLGWRTDGLAAMRDYQARQAKSVAAGADPYPGVGQVLVLDREVSRLYPDGGRRHLVHQVIEMRSKESLDDNGEWVAPDGATVLTLRTIKSDGRIVEPEAIAGKDGLSLRDLERGDFFEMEFIFEEPRDPTIPGWADVTQFRFQSFDTPYHISELIVVHPESLDVRFESRNGAPKVERTIVESPGAENLVSQRFVATEMNRRSPEPAMRPTADELPIVRVFTPLDLNGYLDSIGARMRGAQRRNVELREQVAELARGSVDERDTLERMWGWVMDNIEENAPVSHAATSTLSSRAGSRLMLLRAMLREANVRNELWLVRDRFGPTQVEGGHPTPGAYETPLLAVWPGDAKEPVMVMTGSRALPLGYLTPGYSTSDALRVQLADDESPPGRAEVPASPAKLANRRHYDLSIHVGADGSGTVEGAIELGGLEALLWRDELERLDPDRLEEAFMQAELGGVMGYTALDLDRLKLVGKDDLDAPLRFEFAASGPGLAVPQGGELRMPAALVPMNQGAPYAGLPDRWSGMMVGYAPARSARIELTLDGLKLAEAPAEADLATSYGTYRRSVTSGAGTLVLESESTLRLGVVEPTEYGKFTQFVTDVEAVERAILRLQ